MSGHSREATENVTRKQSGKSSFETGLLNAGTEEQMEVTGYVRSTARTALMWVGYMLTLGLLRLVFHWVPQWYIYGTHVRCPLQHADTVLVVENYQDKFKSYFVKSIKRLSVNSAFSGSTNKRDNAQLKDNRIDTKESSSSSPSTLRIHLNNGSYRDVSQLRAIWVKKLCYIWDNDSCCFIRLAGLEQGFTSTDFHQSRGLSIQEQQNRHVAYGMNEMAVPVQTITTLIFLELLNPFYFFQAFTVIVWGFEGYTYYPIAIIFMSIFGVASSVVQTRKSQHMLHGKVHAYDIVTVCRGEDIYEDVPSSHLVPGDVIVIPTNGCQMLCDAVLITGQCVMNESMLTGESVPVCKTALPSYPVKNMTPHTMFCGTRVIQTRSQGNTHVCAVVMRTGFLTAKGSLVRSILYPPPADYKFENDTYKFIGILAAIATMGLIYTVVAKSTRGIAAFDVVIKALDIITIVIPPALPAAMTVGKLFAQLRLQASSIYCINSRVINVAGAINCVCFDKTGTLTEDGLDFGCTVGVKNNAFIVEEGESKHPMPSDSPLVKCMATCHALTHIEGELAGDPLDIKTFEASGWVLKEDEVNSIPTVLLPMCPSTVQENSFTENTSSKNGCLAGREDIIEYGKLNKTYIEDELQCSNKTEATNANHSSNMTIRIMNQFPFESSLQRMSVITSELNSNDTVVYCKGSPEIISSLSNQETVPLNFQSVLKGFTEQGFRVIATGRRVFAEQSYDDVKALSREAIEKDLEFLGLVVLENKLKVETTPVIRVLKGAQIRPIMVTGDNILTAISVARECGIIDNEDIVLEITAIDGSDGKLPQYCFTSMKSPSTNCPSDITGADKMCVSMDFKLAVTGSSWSVIRRDFIDLLPRLITRGAVFARMTSEQKQQLILHLQEYGYSVAMCGDGANDCAALKAASVGISLSDEESSVASPFTSKEPNISCVPLVIKEGRASLTTAFGIFKFMILYSLVEFMSAIILYSIDSNLADFQFLFIDICLIVHFAIWFGRTEAFTGPLSDVTPTMRLFSTVPLMSITLQMIVMAIFQVASYKTLQAFPWFEPFDYDPDTGSYVCYENYTLFTLSLFQYIIMTIVFSKGAPYRQAIYTNYLLVSGLVLMTVICAYITVYPALWLSNFLELKLPPTYDFRLIILAFGVLNFVSSFFVEAVLIEYVLAQKIMPKFRNPKTSSKKFVRVESGLKNYME